jgi:hypothetical protein
MQVQIQDKDKFPAKTKGVINGWIELARMKAADYSCPLTQLQEQEGVRHVG